MFYILASVTIIYTVKLVCVSFAGFSVTFLGGCQVIQFNYFEFTPFKTSSV